MTFLETYHLLDRHKYAIVDDELYFINVSMNSEGFVLTLDSTSNKRNRSVILFSENKNQNNNVNGSTITMTDPNGWKVFITPLSVAPIYE